MWSKEVLTWDSITKEQKQLIKSVLGDSLAEEVSKLKGGHCELRFALNYTLFTGGTRLSEDLRYRMIEGLFPTICKPTKRYLKVTRVVVRLTESEYENNFSNSSGEFTLEEIV